MPENDVSSCFGRLSPSLSFIRPYLTRQDALAIIPSANVLSECIRNDSRARLRSRSASLRSRLAYASVDM